MGIIPAHMTRLSNIFCLVFALLLPVGALAQGVDAASKTITLGFSSEPPTLNSMESTDQVSSMILAHVKEGLLRYDQHGELAPGVAMRWEVTETSARFWLRRNARWSDGKPVTAHDFVFAWRNALLPATASQYAFILYPIKNAEAINRGELPATALGVTAVGDYELRVELERPCPYFASLTAFMTYYPVREDFFRSRGERYAADAKDMISNGPFMLDKWVHGAALSMAKNPYYWDAQDVKLNRIDIPHMTSDPQAMFNLYRNNSIAMTGLTRELLGKAVELGYPIRSFETGAVYFIEINFRPERATSNLKLRKALQAMIDSTVLVNRIIAIPGMHPTDTLFPRWLKGVEKPFLEEYPPPVIDHSLKRARELMREYLDETGQETPPPLVLLTGENPLAVQQAQYIQYLLREGLGIEVKIDRQIFKQILEKMRAGDFDLVTAGWGPDYNDAMTFADLFTSWNENNRGRYQSEEYDRLVRVAQGTNDQKVRMEAIAAIQQLIADDVVILPSYENSGVYVQDPRLKGVVRSIFGGDPNFRHAWIDDSHPAAAAGATTP
ncbi:MAG: peptide ABC transporter substrate-binding protein [Gammaproteobacteria bacterium]|nr:MAG: peptide ABC transporter substrate-binding protein [Gammaproteobacteria bacterium]